MVFRISSLLSLYFFDFGLIASIISNPPYFNHVKSFVLVERDWLSSIGVSQVAVGK